MSGHQLRWIGHVVWNMTSTQITRSDKIVTMGTTGTCVEQGNMDQGNKKSI